MLVWLTISRSMMMSLSLPPVSSMSLPSWVFLRMTTMIVKRLSGFFWEPQNLRMGAARTVRAIAADAVGPGAVRGILGGGLGGAARTMRVTAAAAPWSLAPSAGPGKGIALWRGRGE